MRHARSYGTVTKRIYRSEIETCLTCGTRLRRYGTLSKRTVITLTGPVRVTHCGYRCPNSECATRTRTYRSAEADSLALPGFTFGLDIIVLVGQTRLGQQRTLDQTHDLLQARLAPYALTISRRETLYLFEAYCTLVRAAQDWTTDTAWHAQVEANGGIIVSIDGIQPDQGNETVYLVRDGLTGRLLAADNVHFSSTEVIEGLLRPIQNHQLPVLGVISDAQSSLVHAIGHLWPTVPHQVCQFHYLREASRPMYELDRHVRKEIRKVTQQPARRMRDQIERLTAKLDEKQAVEAAQLAVLDDYALGIQTALNLDGQQPFHYASLAVDTALTDVALSLEALEKKAHP